MRITIRDKTKQYQNNNGSMRFWGLVSFGRHIDDVSNLLKAELDSNTCIDWAAGKNWCLVCERGQRNEKTISSSSDNTLHVGVIGRVWSLNCNRKRDANLVADLYRVHRENIINQCDGQFAAAIIDEKNSHAVLTVNWPGGFHRLFYCTDGQCLAFANRFELLIQNFGWQAEVNEQAVVDLFRFGGLVDDKSLIKGVNRVMPGFAVFFEKGRAVQKFVYQYPDYKNHKPTDTTEIEHLHREAIEKRISGHSDFGVFLSGGLDSGMNVVTASELSTKPIKTFNISFDSDKLDESPYARIVAAKYNTEHYEIKLDNAGCLDRLPEMVWAMQEPIIDYSYVPTFYVAEAVKKYVNVAISGDGPDHFLGRNYQCAAWYDFVSRIPFGHKTADWLVRVDRNEAMIRHALWRNIRTKRLGRQFWQTLACSRTPCGSGLLNSFSNNLWGDLAPNDLTNILSSDFLRLTNISAYNNLWEDRWNQSDISDSQNKFILADASLCGMCGVFSKVGSMCYANDLTICEPYLATPIIRYFYRIQNSSKVDGSWYQRLTRKIPTVQTKRILRQAAEKHLPDEIILQKQKQGFEFPLLQCWQQATTGLSTKQIFSTLINNTDWFNYKYLDKIVKEQALGKRNHRYMLLLIAALDQWYRIFIRGDASRPIWKWSDCF